MKFSYYFLKDGELDEDGYFKVIIWTCKYLIKDDKLDENTNKYLPNRSKKFSISNLWYEI